MVLALCFVACLVACSKMDAYKAQYEKGGAIVYAGKMDSVNVLSGKKRVEVYGLFTSDPNIVKYRVFWNSRLDSMDFPVTRTSGVDTARGIISGLDEGAQSFEIRTFDKLGNSSVPVYATATVYGDLYQASLVNRGVVDASLQSDSSALITWADVSSAAGILYMEIQYTDKLNRQHDTIIPSVISKQTTSLPNIKLSNAFSYRTAFLPAAGAIDTFYTAYQLRSVKADVTNVYLSNTINFSGTYGDGGRFGTLNAPWVTNAGAKNKGGGAYGGYEHASWNPAGYMTWETWNNTPVVNGKIYQATATPLPAGTYTVSVHYYSEVQNNASVYFVASGGSGEIPSEGNISTALGYVKLFSGASVGATSPNVTETKSFNFTITTPQVVTIGLLGNIPWGNGTSNPGSYLQIQYINLIQN